MLSSNLPDWYTPPPVLSSTKAAHLSMNNALMEQEGTPNISMSMHSRRGSVSSFGSCATGISHPPREGSKRQELVDMTYSEFLQQADQGPFVQRSGYESLQSWLATSSNTGSSEWPNLAEPRSPSERRASQDFSGGKRSPTRRMSSPGYHNTKSPSTKRFKCPYCSTDFSRYHNLKSHLLTHSQEKPYECPTCQTRFRRLHDLKRHMKLHTGEVPHTCHKCGRRFARGDALARHNKGKGGCAGRRPSFGIDEDMGDVKKDVAVDGVE